MHDRTRDPVENIVWRHVRTLTSNAWNPNYVMTPELRLLERSILKQGWIQPVLITTEGLIIDGFHRVELSRSSEQLRQRYDCEVPCVVFDLEEPEAMMLAVRINRAKGQHAALRMSALVRVLIDVHGCDQQEIASGIGATIAEVDLLYQADIFKSKSLDTWEYSRAWIPKESGETPRDRQPQKIKRRKGHKKGSVL